MYNIEIFDQIATLRFDSDSFHSLIDYNNYLAPGYTNDMWNDFQDIYGGNLIRFYNMLNGDDPYHKHVKESMNRFFDAKVIDYLTSKDLL